MLIHGEMKNSQSLENKTKTKYYLEEKEFNINIKYFIDKTTLLRINNFLIVCQSKLILVDRSCEARFVML